MIRLLACGALLAAGGAAHGQSVEELQRLLRERDAQIEALTRRVQALDKPAPDDDETARALERALVREGGMLLRAGVGEVEPQLSYAHWDRSRNTELRYVSEATLVLRAGLGAETQFQARLPYLYVSTDAGSTRGVGDIDLSLSRQFVREAAPIPSIVASIGWLARTGEDSFGGEVPTGGGFNVLQIGATALHRHDPLVYYGGVTYAWPHARDIAGARFEPGETLGLRVGSVLAATPEASVSVGLNLGFVQTTRIDGVPVADSDTTLGTLQIGFGRIVGRSALLNLSGDFRVSGAVPNFRLTASLPIRF